MINRAWTKRLAVLSIEILFGIAVAIAIILYAAYGPFRWMPNRKWITFAVLSSGIFGVPVWWYRSYWKQPLISLTVVTLLAVHLIGFIIFLSGVEEFPPFLVPLCIIVESLVIFSVLNIAVRIDQHRGQTNHG
jgi:hypothetical protein